MRRTPKCDRCGKDYPIKPWESLPAMLGFVTKDGKQINVCRKCIIDIGSMSEPEKAKAFAELGIESEDK